MPKAFPWSSAVTGWRGCAPSSKKRGLSRKAGPPVHADLVGQCFAAGPDQLWLIDITEHPTGEGKLYVCEFKDVWSNRVGGHPMNSRMTASLAIAALRDAIAPRSPTGRHHLDRRTYHWRRLQRRLG